MAEPLPDAAPPPGDGPVVRAARAGDRDAFARLHRDYAPMVHAVLLARVSADDAEDLVQEVFLVALRALPSLDDDERFGAWLAAIARNRAVDHHRRRRGQQPLTEDIPVAPTPRAEALQALEAIRALPEAYRETLIMRLVEGMTGPEIALRCGLTHGSVRVNLHRGMALLRARLGEGRLR